MHRQVRRCACVLLLAVVGLCGPMARRAGAACSVSATPVSFGVYDVFSPAPNDSTGTISFRCEPPDRNVSISIDAGVNGTVVNRQLRNGAELLGYNLYLDAARSTIWGDGTSGTSVYLIKNPPNRDTILTIHGRVPAGQDVAVGTYTDTAIVVINF